VTPETHRRVNVRQATLPAKPLRASREDVFGWNRSFHAHDLPQSQAALLRTACELSGSGRLLRSNVRYATLADQIFVHSAYPTEESDAVFFGPDTYRFARFVRSALSRKMRAARLLDLGAGSGAGGLHAASLLKARFASVTLSDINPRALRFSRINALLNEIENVDIVESDLFAQLNGWFDFIIANPPYLVDPLARLYRHGGGALGSQLSVEIVRQGIGHLAQAGRLLLYTGSPIVNGTDRLYASLRPILERNDLRFHYEEIDPDVFGEELERPPYDGVDRIAVIGLVIDRAC
jgi:SAM-dependent methyltransferase